MTGSSTDTSPEASVLAELRDAASADDADLDLLEVALLLSRLNDPQAEIGAYRRFQDRLTQEIGAYADTPGASPPPLDLQWEALRQVMFKRYGFGGGDDVFDRVNTADIRTVIDRREGLPVAFGVIAIEAFRRLGWSMVGIDFPGRFLVRMEQGSDRLLLDLFQEAREMDPPALRALIKSVGGAEAELAPAHFRVMSPRRVLLRLQENIRIRQIQAGDLEDARQTVETMLILAPDTPHLWREAGMLSAKLERIGEAIQALEKYLALGPAEGDGYEASLILQELRQRLN